MPRFAPALFFIGKLLLVGVFLYFGIGSIFDPTMYSHLIPDFVANVVNPDTVVMIHGVIEVVCGLAILFGIGGMWPYLILIVSFIGVILSVSGPTQARDAAILGGILLLLARYFETEK